MSGKCSALLDGMLSLRREFDSGNAIDFAWVTPKMSTGATIKRPTNKDPLSMKGAPLLFYRVIPSQILFGLVRLIVIG